MRGPVHTAKHGLDTVWRPSHSEHLMIKPQLPFRIRRQSLPAQVAHEFLAAIVGGAYEPGSQLPPEPELVALTGVSRLTLREAMKVLQAMGVVRVEQGRGTFVNPPSSWNPLDPMVLSARAAGPDAGTAVGLKLLEARRLVEVGVAELAAVRRSEAQLDAMTEALVAQRSAHDAGDTDRFVAADITFHQALMEAAGNEVVAALFGPIQSLVYEGRRLTSSWPEARALAIKAHERILAAVRRQDPGGARRRMLEHLEATAAALEEHTTTDP
jgi:GntR family transcriptional repressor for pyruvate dehydrogenase complex